MGAELTFDLLRSLSGNTDVTDAPCPACLDECRTAAGRKRKCLRIWDNGEDFITFTCARCQISGFAKPDDDASGVRAPQPKVDKPPEDPDKPDMVARSRLLWDKSLPAIGTAAQRYLESRSCWNPSTSIRFLPGREINGRQYHPAMISRFGFEEEPVTGVHLTLLKPDGSGKAEVDNAKLTLGESMGQPIVVHINEDHDELLIAEGIEDTASMVLATGWGGWAAGTANRIPHVVATAVKQGFQKIYVAKDADTLKRVWQHQTWGKGGKVQLEQEPASWHALSQAALIAPIIPLPFGKIVVGFRDGLDANLFLRRYGKQALAAAIEWCELLNQADLGLLPLHEFYRKRTRLQQIIFPRT